MTEPQQTQYESLTGCLLKAYWTLLGPGLLFVAGAAGAANKPRLGSVWDYALAAILLSLVAARLLDRSKPAAEPAPDGGKARLNSGKYIGIVVAIAAAIFGIIHWVIPMIF